MKIKIPLIKKVLVLEVENSLDQKLIDIINQRYKNYDGLWCSSRIEAIKYYRSIFSTAGLLESKNYVDNLIRANKIPHAITDYEYESWEK